MHRGLTAATMPAKNRKPEPTKATPAGLHAGAPMVLVVSACPLRRESLARAMLADNLPCSLTDSIDAAVVILGPNRAAAAGPYEAVLVDLPACTPEALRAVRQFGARRVAAVLVCPTVSFDDAVAAMRAGAADVVNASIKPKDLGKRVRSAVAQARAAQPPRDPSREPAMPRHREPDADEPTPAARPRTGKGAAPVQVPLSALCEQFQTVIRAELDVETLLRQVLEFILAHFGPTNAAVFLPGTTGDYSLGAYVNYTCPKDTVEVLLDHLANIAAPRLEHTTGVLYLRTPQQLTDRLGDSADWLLDHGLVGFTCRSPRTADDPAECLAVFTLFRDRSTPFDPRQFSLLQELSEVFGRQLARVIRIHHRHLPKDQWGSLGDPADDADDRGGMAA
ncbi:MAG: hypothetical protein ACKVS8_10800 [Phycisphaerales bacterium]